MRLQFLGTGGFHPNEERHTACVWLPEQGVVFDAGTSLFRLPPRLVTRELQLFLTHAHLDHVCGLTYLLAPLLTKTLDRCRVYGTEAVLDAVESHLFCPAIFPIRPPVDFVPLTASVPVPGGLVQSFPLHHPGGAMGYRYDRDDGFKLAYISDTNANDDCVPFLRGVDVLIHECNYPDRLSQWCEPTGHSHTSQVARLAALAGVKQLILTHLDPQQTGPDPVDLAAARRIFLQTLLASDLLELDLP
jgi:ribonuclease Z